MTSLSPVARTRAGELLRAAAREPIFHFLALAVLFTLGERALRARVAPELRVEATTLAALGKEWAQRKGRPPTPADTAEIRRAYVEDEVLFREALRQGVAEDSRVRALIVETFRDSLRPVLPEPGDDELLALRPELPAELRTFPAQVSFEHLSYPPGEAVPGGVLERLRGGEAPASIGASAVQLANPLPLTFRPQIARVLGEEFAAGVFALAPGQWAGPLASSRGTHFVRVLEQHEARDIPFAEIRQALAARWRTLQEDAAVSRAADELQRKYRVVEGGTPRP